MAAGGGEMIGLLRRVPTGDLVCGDGATGGHGGIDELIRYTRPGFWPVSIKAILIPLTAMFLLFFHTCWGPLGQKLYERSPFQRQRGLLLRRLSEKLLLLSVWSMKINNIVQIFHYCSDGPVEALGTLPSCQRGGV